VEQVDARENRITIKHENGEHQSYDPRRLAGVAVYQEVERAFSEGDRVQFTAPSKDLHVANRELGPSRKSTTAATSKSGIDSGREVAFNIREHPRLDHGYAVTSHSRQGQTAQRVLIHVDTEKSGLLVNNRFAYVSVSRAQHDARIYTDDGRKLSRSLSRESSRRTATEVEQQPTTPKTETASPRGVRPSEEEQGHSLGLA
jgi:ATP-dependent exoDNAse (exonuclease V) alpha subunit